jgi:hypothetical protein
VNANHYTPQPQPPPQHQQQHHQHHQPHPEIPPRIQIGTEKDLGVVTFHQETKEKAEQILEDIKTFRNQPELMLVQSDAESDNLIPCKYYLIWIDWGSRNTILERPNRGEGSLRRNTFQRAKQLGGWFYLF